MTFDNFFKKIFSPEVNELKEDILRKALPGKINIRRKIKKGMDKKVQSGIIAAVVCILALIFLRVTDTVPEFHMLEGLVEVGLDYITLSYDKNAVSEKELLSELDNVTVSHPFILADSDAFSASKKEYLDGSFTEYTSELSDYVFSNADALLNEDIYPVMEYVLDEEDSILPISRETVNRIIILGYAYNISGETKYADRAVKELMNVCSYPDWCPSHFLATAEMALAVSIGYDWFFDYLSDEQKDLLSETAWSYAIEPALSKNYLKNWFTWSKNNWNSICYSGIGIACMTFYERSPERAAEFLHMCYKNMPIAFTSFTPDGVYAEGPGYSESGMNSIIFFISTSESFFGTAFGMDELDGVKQLGAFPIYIATPTGTFNFGDNKDRMFYSPVLHWYSSRYDRPLLSAYQKGNAINEFTEDSSTNTERNGTGKENALSLLWLDRSRDYDSVDFSEEENVVFLDSDAGQQLVIMRSAYQDENASYAAIKGGYNYINHGDLDIGTFVFDALGERWAEELGAGSYDAPGYFTALPYGGRWLNYCKRAEGQNTLVINPGHKREDQYAFAHSEFISFDVTSDGGICKLDMTDAYSMNKAKKVTRQFRMFNNCTSLEIRDEISCKTKSDIYWFMHTKADIEISSDGRTAILTKNSKQVKVTLHNDGIFTVMPAESFNGKYEYDADYSDISKLTVHLTDTKEAVITVSIEPVYN